MSDEFFSRIGADKACANGHSQRNQAHARHFHKIREQVLDFSWNNQFQISQIPSPKRIAPYALALEAEIHRESSDYVLGMGKLILLFDPEGNPAWSGTHRAVSYVQADIDLNMICDPLLAEVGWTWLQDALAACDAHYHEASGTVTSVTSKSFGALASQPDSAEIEIRSSWTVDLDDRGIVPHLRAWQELLRATSGMPPEITGIIPLNFRAEH